MVSLLGLVLFVGVEGREQKESLKNSQWKYLVMMGESDQRALSLMKGSVSFHLGRIR